MTGEIERHLRRAPHAHVYELGDLDPREAPHTTWFTDAPVTAVALLYRGLAVPTLVGLADDGDDAPLLALLARHAGGLPDRFYAHLTAGAEAPIAERFTGELLGDFWKLGLKLGLLAPAATAVAPDPAVRALTPRDAAAATAFYAAHYPGCYFEPSNLERGPYLALDDDRGIAAIAGVHVYAPALRVAAIGNVATRADARGRGYGRRITGALCRVLLAEVDVIGLNVRADNAAALACYRGLGFERVAAYREWRFERRAPGRTALTAAAEHGQLPELRAALAAGARVDELDGDGFPALALAACFGHVEVVRALLAAGASVDAATARGKTPLMYAAEGGHEAIVALLLARGADPARESAAGTTALGLATIEGHAAIAHLLTR